MVFSTVRLLVALAVAAVLTGLQASRGRGPEPGARW